MKLAYRTTFLGITSVVAAESRAHAKAITMKSAEDANYRVKFTDVRCHRAPEHDAWAEVDETRICWEERLLPAMAEENIMDAPTPKKLNDFDNLMQELANKLDSFELVEESKDWRIGLSVKVKYRTHDLYYEPPHKVLDVYPSGHAGIVDKDGVLKLESVSGKVFLAPADEWRTA